MGLQFEEAADFTMLKQLIVDAATENELNIFDDVFDWSLLLSSQRVHSQQPIAAQSLLAAPQNQFWS